MSADNKNCLNFVKIIAGLPGTYCSYSRQRTVYLQCTSIAVHITVVTRFSVFTCPCQQVNHGSLSTTHAWLIHSIASPCCQHSADRKRSLLKCLRRRSRNQILSNQRQNWVNVWLFFLMPEFDGTATKRTCVDISDALINVASDRSDHQCCGSCMTLAWLLLLCHLGCRKWENN